MVAPSRNYQKHTNANPLQRWLLTRFHAKIVELAMGALREDGWLTNHPAESRGRPPQVLDVGCGEGFVLRHLGDHITRLHLHAVDRSRQALRLARQQAKPESLLCADASALPYASNALDLVLCLEVLEHLRRPDLALAELGRVARGPLIVSVPNQPYFSLANLARGKNVRRWGDDAEHEQHWRAKPFVALLRQSLGVQRVVYSFPWVIVLCRKSIRNA